jgi:hypothetical protein
VAAACSDWRLQRVGGPGELGAGVDVLLGWEIDRVRSGVLGLMLGLLTATGADRIVSFRGFNGVLGRPSDHVRGISCSWGWVCVGANGVLSS